MASPRKTILVVDDFEDIRVSLRLLLEKRGYHVEEAQDGREAIRTARAALPDLILMDLFMPKQDGFAAAREIRAAPELSGVPIVAVSAYGELGIEDRLQKQARATGFSGYLSKPFHPDELLAVVAQLIDEDAGPEGARPSEDPQ